MITREELTIGEKRRFKGVDCRQKNRFSVVSVPEAPLDLLSIVSAR